MSLYSLIMSGLGTACAVIAYVFDPPYVTSPNPPACVQELEWPTMLINAVQQMGIMNRRLPQIWSRNEFISLWTWVFFNLRTNGNHMVAFYFQIQWISEVSAVSIRLILLHTAYLFFICPNFQSFILLWIPHHCLPEFKNIVDVPFTIASFECTSE